MSLKDHQRSLLHGCVFVYMLGDYRCRMLFFHHIINHNTPSDCGVVINICTWPCAHRAINSFSFERYGSLLPIQKKNTHIQYHTGLLSYLGGSAVPPTKRGWKTYRRAHLSFSSGSLTLWHLWLLLLILYHYYIIY